MDEWPGQRLGLPESGPRSIARFGRRVAALFIDWAIAWVIAAAFFADGPFQPNADGDPFPGPRQVKADFEHILELGGNCIRVYHVPPTWMLDMASKLGLKIFLDVAWPKNLSFIENPDLMRQAHEAVRHAAKCCGNHDAIFAISVVNGVLNISVTDNGRGFEAASAAPGSDGLTGMKQRMQKLGGDCNVRSEAGRGTTVEFQLPLGRKEP